MANRLLEIYRKDVMPKVMEKFGYTNSMQAPRLNKIVINMGVGSASQDPKHLEMAIADMTAITGQKPQPTIAKRAEAGFKIREGMKIGCKVTLRGKYMYNFFDKLVNVAMPRIKDFRGVSDKAFDRQGNYALGLKEQSIFPEIDPDGVVRVQGMDIIFDIRSASPAEARELLSLLGMPFRR